MSRITSSIHSVVRHLPSGGCVILAILAGCVTRHYQLEMKPADGMLERKITTSAQHYSDSQRQPLDDEELARIAALYGQDRTEGDGPCSVSDTAFGSLNCGGWRSLLFRNCWTAEATSKATIKNTWHTNALSISFIGPTRQRMEYKATAPMKHGIANIPARSFTPNPRQVNPKISKATAMTMRRENLSMTT
jgi:hypothetical protein